MKKTGTPIAVRMFGKTMLLAMLCATRYFRLLPPFTRQRRKLTTMGPESRYGVQIFGSFRCVCVNDCLEYRVKGHRLRQCKRCEEHSDVIKNKVSLPFFLSQTIDAKYLRTYYSENTVPPLALSVPRALHSCFDYPDWSILPMVGVPPGLNNFVSSAQIINKLCIFCLFLTSS